MCGPPLHTTGSAGLRGGGHNSHATHRGSRKQCGVLRPAEVRVHPVQVGHGVECDAYGCGIVSVFYMLIQFTVSSSVRRIGVIYQTKRLRDAT